MLVIGIVATSICVVAWMALVDYFSTRVTVYVPGRWYRGDQPELRPRGRHGSKLRYLRQRTSRGTGRLQPSVGKGGL